MQLSKKIVLGLSLALVLSLIAPETSKACFWPFAPPGSFAAWRAQNLQRRSMRLSMVAQRRAMIWGGGAGYGGGCGYSQYGYAGGGCNTGCCPTGGYGGYSNFGGCPTGGCGTGGCATTTFYAPNSYGYATNNGCCNTCGSSTCGPNGCSNGGCYSSDTQGTNPVPDNKTSGTSSSSTSTFASDKIPTPVDNSKATGGATDGGFKPPTKNETYNNGGDAAPFNMKSMKLNLDPQNSIDEKKEIKTPNSEDETKKEEVFTIPLPKLIDVAPQIAWNKTVRRSRVGRNARFTLPMVARSTNKAFRPIDIIERAETQIASK